MWWHGVSVSVELPGFPCKKERMVLDNISVNQLEELRAIEHMYLWLHAWVKERHGYEGGGWRWHDF